MSRYIDADALEKKLEEERTYLLNREQYGAEHILVHHALNVLDEMPTADVKPVVRGEWEDKEVFETAEEYIEQWQSARCSACGKYHTTPYMYYFDKFNYCPNCGAKMEGRK